MATDMCITPYVYKTRIFPVDYSSRADLYTYSSNTMYTDVCVYSSNTMYSLYNKQLRWEKDDPKNETVNLYFLSAEFWNSDPLNYGAIF